MESTITERGQTVVPARIRKAFGLNASTKLRWVVDSAGIHVIPLGDDPIVAFMGSGKRAGWGGSTDDLLADRREDLRREEAKLARWLDGDSGDSSKA